MKNITLIGLFFWVIATNAQLKPIIYQDETQKLNGFVSKPQKNLKDKPGILILPAWRGIDNLSKVTALKLSKLGYFAFIADIYGEGNVPKDNAEAGQKAGLYKKNYELYLKRIQLALNQLIINGANPNKIVVIGYCFGGTGALEAARANMKVQGVVSFHGGLAKEATREIHQMVPKVLVCHGADDPFVSANEVNAFQQEMKTAKADWQMIYYANAVHSFTNPEAGTDNSQGAAYNEKAAQRSWQHFINFINEILK